MARFEMSINLPKQLRHTTIILWLIVFMFLADGANSVLRNLGTGFFRVSIFVRAIVQLYFVLLLLNKAIRKNVIIFILIFYTIFGIGTLFSIGVLYRLSEYDFLGNFAIVNKMLFFFISWEVYRHYFSRREEIRRFVKLFELLFLTQAVVIIFAFLFNLDILAAYYSPARGVWRFGYQGLIPAQNEIAPFLIIAFFYFLYKAHTTGQDVVKLLIITFAGVLTGTKAVLIILAVFILYLVIWLFPIIRLIIRRNHLLLFLIILLVIVPVSVIGYDHLKSRLIVTIDYFSSMVSRQGIISAIFTGRNFKIRNFVNHILPKFTIANYLFGGHNLERFSTELDLIDVFARFGLIGGSIFYYYYIKILLTSGVSVDVTRFLFVICWITISAFAGHIVFSAIIGTYLPFLVIEFSHNKAKNRKLKWLCKHSSVNSVRSILKTH